MSLTALLHRLQATYHSLDARPNLLVLLQQGRPLCRQRILTLLERAILILQRIADFDQCINALFQSFQLLLENCSRIVSHSGNIELPGWRINPAGKITVFRMEGQGNPWDHASASGNYNFTERIVKQVMDYEELEVALRRCGSTWEAAQVHGMLCSRLATAGPAAGQDWMLHVLDGVEANSDMRAECETMLESLFGSSYQQLSERQSAFMPMLPDEFTPAEVRALALGQWCEGFLHGLVSGQSDDRIREKLASEPLAELIKDLLQISRAAVDDDDEGEETETAYTELVEYVRVAAQLAYEELADIRDGTVVADNEAGPLH